jgi:cell division septation protein DedD
MTMKLNLKLFAAAAAIAIGAPALADVKAGVDAWGRGDYAKAIAEWRTPAMAGDADAQFNLGQAYKLGRGVPVDQAIAIEWFRKAAEQGHAQAQDNYGLALFQDGRKAEALPWLEKSVARDEKRAELVLGTMLFNGDGVPRDWTRAYALVTRSSQQGLPQGSQTLAQMDKYLPEDQRRDGIALAQKIEGGARYATAKSAPAQRPAPALTAAEKPVAKPVTLGGTTYPAPAARPTPAPVVAAKPVAKPLPAPAAAADGNWRIQLGAFGDPANARRLWSQVGTKVGGTADFVKTGALTKLQATGFPSRAAAQQACARAGGGCVVVNR